MKSEQMKMDIDGEISAELAEEDKGALHSGRTPFVLRDFEPQRDREMAVFTSAKKLAEYIFVITEKSPKKFRWSIVTRLQNAAVDVIESLYRANFERGTEERIAYQKSALVNLNLVDFFAETARSKQAINLHQTEVIAKQIGECKKLLNGWVRATKGTK